MAASAIIISSDSSDESVGSPPSRVILFGDIPTVIPSTSSSHEFPIAPVTAPPGIRRRSATLIRPGEAIPFGRPYRTHLNGPRKLLTARKRVGPLPARRLASRHASPRSPDHHSSSSSSSSDSSPVHSLGLDASDQAHSGSSTRDVSPRLCYPPRRAPRRSEAFRHWCAAPLSTLYPPTTSESSSGGSPERPMHLSSHSAGPSRKRCRSPVDLAPLSMPVTGSLAPTRTDLSPPRKRFRDSYSSEASMEEDAEVGLTRTGVDMELGIGDGDEIGDHVEIDHRDARDDTEEYEADASAGDIAEVGIDPMTAPLIEEEIVEPAGEDSPKSSGTRDGIVRSVEDMPVDLGDVVRDFYHHMSEVRVDRIIGIKTAQRRLEADQLIASGDRARMAQMIYSLRVENLKVRAMLDIERDRVSSLHLHMSLSQEEFCQIRRDRDDARGRLRRFVSSFNTIAKDGSSLFSIFIFHAVEADVAEESVTTTKDQLCFFVNQLGVFYQYHDLAKYNLAFQIAAWGLSTPGFSDETFVLNSCGSLDAEALELIGTSVSTTFAQDAPSISYSPSSSGIQPPVIHHDVAVGPTIEDTPITQATLHPLVNPVTGEPSSAQSSSGDVSIVEPNQANQLPAHLRK
ncbi:hypothetical protein Tco_1321605 [Tanacetum coccineum]